MTPTHHHRGDDGRRSLELNGAARRSVLVFVLAAGVLTLVGCFFLWPRGQPPILPGTNYAAPGVTFPRAEVTQVLPACPAPGPAGVGASAPQPGDATVSGSAGTPATQQPAPTSASIPCGKVTATVLGGSGRGQSVTIFLPTEVIASGLQPGDTILLLRLPDTLQVPGAILDSPYSYAGVERATPLWVLAAVFAVMVVLVARLRGLAALAGLVISGAMLLKFVAPSLLAGHDAVQVGIVGSLLIMYPVLYLTHGLSTRTSTALVGTIVGVLLIAGVGDLAVAATRLTGVSDDDGGTLQALAGSVSLHGLVTCGIIIGGLGALNDVTITQTSAVWELRQAAPDLPRRRLFASAMQIGRDHLASTVYTLVFAYVGAAMPILLLLSVYNRPWGDVLTSEDVATEIVRTISSAFGLTLAIPVTTLIAVLVVSATRTGRHEVRPRADEPLATTSPPN